MMQMIEDVAKWCDGVGHTREHAGLYTGLIAEEAAESMKCVELDPDGASIVHRLDALSKDLRKSTITDHVEALDAALDVAWVALCQAYLLLGSVDKVQAAWNELYRSNVVDKQIGGFFVKGDDGKVIKPEGWRPPDFAQFF